MALTYGQWLQIKTTRVPFLPRTSDNFQDFRSIPGREKSGAFHPKLHVGVFSAIIRILTSCVEPLANHDVGSMSILSLKSSGLCERGHGVCGAFFVGG